MWMEVKNLFTLCLSFKLSRLNIRVGAGTASRYGSGSTKMMVLLLAPVPQHIY
jgi:hypothetical protein